MDRREDANRFAVGMTTRAGRAPLDGASAAAGLARRGGEHAD